MATDEEIRLQVEKTNSERSLLELQMEGERYKRMRSSSSTVTRVQPLRRKKICSTDNIIFSGINGTLGTRTLEAGEEVIINNWKSKCVAYLCRNIIIDFSNKKQLKLIGISSSKLENRFKLNIKFVSDDIDNLNKATKKATNHQAFKDLLLQVELYKYANLEDRAVKMIYIHIINQLAHQPILFTTVSQKNFSEMSFLIKFWGPIMEQFFNSNQYFIQWGDTTSPQLSLHHLNVRLDLRVIIEDINNTEHDVATGEFANHSSTLPRKTHRDFLKSALTTKIHLNAILHNMNYIPLAEIKKVVMPMIQFMGLSCFIYGMNIIDKKVYSLQKLSSFSYPSTEREVRTGSIKKLIEGFSLIKTMIDNIENMITEYSKAPSRVMSGIKNDRKEKSKASTFNINEYTSPVTSYPSFSYKNKEQDSDDDDINDTDYDDINDTDDEDNEE